MIRRDFTIAIDDVVGVTIIVDKFAASLSAESRVPKTVCEAQYALAWPVAAQLVAYPQKIGPEHVHQSFMANNAATLLEERKEVDPTAVVNLAREDIELGALTVHDICAKATRYADFGVGEARAAWLWDASVGLSEP